jgi:zinc/manganese transport system ATP-binding protein
VLSDLYGAPVQVFRAAGRLVVVGIPDAEPHHPHEHHDHEHHGDGAEAHA